MTQEERQEREEAFLLGYISGDVLKNPYWPNYPKPSKDEDLARWFVDGYLTGWREYG